MIDHHARGLNIVRDDRNTRAVLLDMVDPDIGYAAGHAIQHTVLNLRHGKNQAIHFAIQRAGNLLHRFLLAIRTGQQNIQSVLTRAFFQAFGQLGEKFTVHFLWKNHPDDLLAAGAETTRACIGQIVFLLDDGQNTLAQRLGNRG